jgi:hypothetical protein
LSDKEMLSGEYIIIPDYSGNRKQESSFQFTDMFDDILSFIPDVDLSGMFDGFEFPDIDL